MNDRRRVFRFKPKYAPKVLVSTSETSLNGSVVDLSPYGAQIVFSQGLCIGTKFKLRFTKEEEFSNDTYEGVVNRSVFETETGKHIHGVKFLNPLFSEDQPFPFLRDYPLEGDRRVGGGLKDFPLKRRNIDYSLIMMRDPHWAFFEALLQVSQRSEPHTIVLANNLVYLTKRIRKLFPEPRIIPVGRLRETLIGPVIVVMSIDTRRKHEAFTFLDFDEYLSRKMVIGEPTRTLTTLSRHISAGEEIDLLTLCPIQNQPLARKYLSVARFDGCVFISPHWIKAKKRNLLITDFDDSAYRLKEIEDQAGIENIQSFAARLFNGKNNYDMKIDSLFNSHSDFYGIFSNATGEIINFARVTHHLPGHFLPLMLAGQSNSDKHIILKDPDTVYYGEVFSPYIRSLAAARVYSKLVRVIISYGETGRINTMFTTFDANDPKSLRFFSKYLGFADTRMSLRYGTFGGDWGLIYCSHRSFKETVELQLTSTLGAPRLVTEAVQ